MPGVGKSYWAEQIAAAYAMQCIDLDNIIEVRTGMSIGSFFERYGEAEFRKLEQVTLRQVIEVFGKNCVVACGGGTPCFYDNLAQMKSKGTIVYLEASISTICAQLAQEHQKRPLLQLADWQDKLASMLQQRAPIFEQADCILATKDLTIADFKSILSA